MSSPFIVWAEIDIYLQFPCQNFMNTLKDHTACTESLIMTLKISNLIEISQDFQSAGIFTYFSKQ